MTPAQLLVTIRETDPVVEALELFSRHYARLNGSASSIYPGVREGLAAMRAGGLRLACVTNKAARFTHPLLEAKDLARCFDTVVTSDEAGRRKPDPAIFLRACDLLGVPPAQAVVVGDSDNDGRGARAAGCRFLLLPYGYREGRGVHEIECDGIVDSLVRAAEAVLSFGTQPSQANPLSSLT